MATQLNKTQSFENGEIFGSDLDFRCIPGDGIVTFQTILNRVLLEVTGTTNSFFCWRKVTKQMGIVGPLGKKLITSKFVYP